MLRTVGDQPSLWESILPEGCLGMPAELEAVDRLLDDPGFFEPYRAFFHATLGRPSIPIETYLRLMFLKYRYKLGFEPLCREVADSITWQRFCRIPLGGVTPHPTTLMKITTRCGPSAIDGLNDALLVKAAEEKVLKTNRCGLTPRWWKPTSRIRWTRRCWPRVSLGSRGSRRVPRRRVWRRGRWCGIGRVRCIAGLGMW
jgi:IS5 family transposase